MKTNTGYFKRKTRKLQSMLSVLLLLALVLGGCGKKENPQAIVEESVVNAEDYNHTADAEAAADALFDADIAATCVGAKALKYIIANFSNGVKKRVAANRPPLNLLICENLMDADKYIHSMLEETLTTEELEQVGLIEDHELGEGLYLSALEAVEGAH